MGTMEGNKIRDRKKLFYFMILFITFRRIFRSTSNALSLLDLMTPLFLLQTMFVLIRYYKTLDVHVQRIPYTVTKYSTSIALSKNFDPLFEERKN